MGNAHAQTKAGSVDVASSLKSYPMRFHATHSENIQVSPNKRSARRIESFCKGICFGSRPVAINERVYIKFAEISTNWSGVLRFGYTSNDPTNIDASTLPRYACPDLTSRPGFFAKALPEETAKVGNVLYFQIHRNGEVHFGVNDQDRGLFFAGLMTDILLWPVVDIYGNTLAMEFVEGRQVSNISPIGESLLMKLASTSLDPALPAEPPPLPPPAPVAYPSPPPAVPAPTNYPVSPSHAAASSPALLATPPSYQLSAAHSAVPALGPSGAAAHSSSQLASPLSRAHTVHSTAALSNSGPNLGVSYYTSYTFRPFPFNAVHGRNVNLSSDKTIAVRSIEDFCNAYVFTPRPLQCGERLVVQVLSVDKTFEGGIAFGMTACDPSTLNPKDLPDDSDLLLDRLEYWVVNKDVCTNPEVRDELSFHLTIEGEVKYGRNGHNIATLMHVDKTLPMWAFLDVYGTTQKIKCLGLASLDRSPSISSVSDGRHSPHRRHMPMRNFSVTSLPVTSSSPSPPPRPPPPRPSPGSLRSSPLASPVAVRHDHVTALAPPSLPPKQRSPSVGVSGASSVSGVQPSDSSASGSMSLPPPLIPIPAQKQMTPPHLPAKQLNKPAIPPRSIDKAKSTPPPQPQSKNALVPEQTCDTSMYDQRGNSDLLMTSERQDSEEDSSNNECCVCLENPPNCVVYTCGHMCMCYACAMDIKNAKDALCPMCRQEIKDVIRIFKS